MFIHLEDKGSIIMTISSNDTPRQAIATINDYTITGPADDVAAVKRAQEQMNRLTRAFQNNAALDDKNMNRAKAILKNAAPSAANVVARDAEGYSMTAIPLTRDVIETSPFTGGTVVVKKPVVKQQLRTRQVV
jgi:hypothetical protein